MRPLQVVHRDIKPDNPFLTNVGGKPHVKILDFGISKMAAATPAKAQVKLARRADKRPFSPAYGALEQWVAQAFRTDGGLDRRVGPCSHSVEIIKGDAAIVGDHQAMMGTALDPLSRPTPRKEGVEVTDEIESVLRESTRARSAVSFPNGQGILERATQSR